MHVGWLMGLSVGCRLRRSDGCGRTCTAVETNYPSGTGMGFRYTQDPDGDIVSRGPGY